MLKNILFCGFEVVEYSYKLIKKTSGAGSYNLNIDKNGEVEVTELLNSDEVHVQNQLVIPVSAIIKGVEAESDEPVFQTDVKLQLTFEMDSEVKVTSEYVDENEWFFMNFAQSSLNHVVEDLMRHTNFNGVRVPIKRIEDDK